MAAFAYSLPAPLPAGLPKGRFVATLGLMRADDKPLTKADIAAIEQACGVVDGEPVAPPEKTKRAAPASKAKAARTAKR